MDQQPKIPTLKDSQKPQVKVRGMGIGLTLAERLKQFKKKDLAFILAGLGVLFMAPLAEHFMMAPETADGSLQPGWSGKGGSGSGASGVFGAGGSPYDRTDGLAPGSPTGGGSDVITPLNVRDPSALVMGPGAAQQPPTNSALPATPPSAPSSRSDSDLKDALAASARGIGAAAKKAPMPVPKVALGGSGLRGLGVAGGGSSASASLGPISAANVPNRAAGGDSTSNARSTKGFSGVARGQTSGGGGIDALKAAAGKQAENMNRGQGAAADINAAANTAIPSGGDSRGGGGPGGGKDDKGFGGNQDKSGKTVGESLDFINKKERMQKDMELEYKKKELNDFGLLWGEMRKEGMKTLFSEGLIKPIAKAGGELIGGLFEKAGPKNQYRCPGIIISGGTVGQCGSPGIIYSASPGSKNVSLYLCTGTKEDHEQNATHKGCGKETLTSDGDTTVDDSGRAVTVIAEGMANMNPTQLAAVASLSDVCASAREYITKATEKAPVAPASTGSPATSVASQSPEVLAMLAWAREVQAGANRIVSAQQALMGIGVPTGCHADPPVNASNTTSVKDLQAQTITKMGTHIGSARKALDSDEPNAVPQQEDLITEAASSARSALGLAKTYMEVLTDPGLPIGVEGKGKENAVATQAKVVQARASVDLMLNNLSVNQKSIDKQLGANNEPAGPEDLKSMAFRSDGKIFGAITQNAAWNEIGNLIPNSGLESAPAIAPVPEVGKGGLGTSADSETKRAEAQQKIEAAEKAITDHVILKKGQEAVISEAEKGSDTPGAKKEVIDAANAKIASSKTSTEGVIKEAAGKVLVMRTTFAGWADAIKINIDAAGRLVIAPAAAVPAASAAPTPAP